MPQAFRLASESGVLVDLRDAQPYGPGADRRYRRIAAVVEAPFLASSRARPDPVSAKYKAAFLDRDGVLNKDLGYVGSSNRFVWIAGAVDAVARLRAAGYRVFVVTNQSGVARGFYTEADVVELHAAMQRDLVAAGTRIDDFIFCPHHPDGREAPYAIACTCRKPEPGMLLTLIERHDIDPAASLMIGDKETDLTAAHRADVRGFLFGGGRLDHFVDDLLAFLGAANP